MYMLCAKYGSGQSVDCLVIHNLRNILWIVHAIHGLYRVQSMDQHNPWIVLRKLSLWIVPTCLTQSMDLNCDACTMVDPRFIPGGRQCMYVPKHGQAFRHAEKGYHIHSDMHAFATDRLLQMSKYALYGY